MVVAVYFISAAVWGLASTSCGFSSVFSSVSCSTKLISSTVIGVGYTKLVIFFSFLHYEDNNIKISFYDIIGTTKRQMKTKREN